MTMTTTPAGASSMSVIPVLGSSMAYRAAHATQSPVALFLHGNPTSSFIWRNIIPHLASVASCIAPDLIGFGKSGKPRIGYRFADHVRYLDAFLDGLGIHSAYVVAQDWGTALAFELAARRAQFMRGLACMEFIRPLPSWDDFHQLPAARTTFQKFPTPGVGEELVLDGNAFIERVLPGSVVRKLSDAEMTAYREPFLTPATRMPILALPRELPIGGEPARRCVRQDRGRTRGAEASRTFPSCCLPATPARWCRRTSRRVSPRRSSICHVVQAGIRLALPAGGLCRCDRPRRGGLDRRGRSSFGTLRFAARCVTGPER
jgi:haloalkane dehalogenase